MEIGSSIIVFINVILVIEFDNFNFLFIVINIVRYIVYFVIFLKLLDDNNIFNNVDMNIGILYLLIFDVYIKKVIFKGVIEFIIIDLLSKNFIIVNVVVVKLIYLFINFMIFGFIVLFFIIVIFFCIKKFFFLFILRIVIKRSNFFCYNWF